MIMVKLPETPNRKLQLKIPFMNNQFAVKYYLFEIELTTNIYS